MANTKNIEEKETVPTQKAEEQKVETQEEVKAESIQPEEEAKVDQQQEETITSLDLIWRHAFQELDAWAERANYRDEIFLNTAKLYADELKRNRDGIQAIAEQFNKELAEWERTAREELLMSTTTLQHFFPVHSYEEINRLLDNIQSRTTDIALAPYRKLTSSQTIDKFVDTIEQYIVMSQRGRMQYIKNVKQTANIIYDSQKGFVNLFANQLKTVLFPFSKYLDKGSEPAKS